MKKNKLKIAALSIGTIGTILAPVATLVACNDSNVSDTSSADSIATYKVLPTYTGQADQLIALGIKSDYYP